MLTSDSHHVNYKCSINWSRLPSLSILCIHIFFTRCFCFNSLCVKHVDTRSEIFADLFWVNRLCHTAICIPKWIKDSSWLILLLLHIQRFGVRANSQLIIKHCLKNTKDLNANNNWIVRIRSFFYFVTNVLVIINKQMYRFAW